MDNNNQKLNKLRQLQKKYLSQLPDQISTLNTAWLGIIHDKSPTALNTLRQLTHNLTGSAGTFGFPAISDEARELENCLNTHEDIQSLDEAALKLIEQSLRRITNLSKLTPDNPADVKPSSAQLSANNKDKQLIYVIEDDPLIAEEICTQLNYFGYQVQTFPTTEDASQTLKERMPSIMLIDIELPDGDLAGPEFAKLFNRYSMVHVPIIFISARDDWQARLAAAQAEGSAYLTKPLDFNELIEQLENLTSHHEPEPFKVLVVDDVLILAEHYATVLSSSGMDVKTLSNLDELLEQLSDFKPDLILMDVHMPQCSGLDAAKVIRQKNELLSVPIVFLSTEQDPLKRLSAMALGGDDFLQKPISDERLLAAVRTRAARFRKLRSLMLNDGLTGLLNHVTIKMQLETEISRSQRKGEPLSFAMIDIDHFKAVNDSYGHPIGDRVLKSVARMLKKRLRKSDLIGRYGGEEFAIILPQTDLKTAENLLHDVRQTFSQITQHCHGAQFSCTLSAGIAQLKPDDTTDNLIKMADKALYQAKNGGRNAVSKAL
ncbi:MAG: diguanylate cyclase [Cycloclasticus sp.]|nr:diguanylate cyclase [Cycloclasticus sp.]MBQ0789162.1 diguanylate cyclase [Cycloclasticus sp.]